MFNQTDIPNKTIAYFAIIAILIGLGVAYFVSQPQNSDETSIIRAIQTGQDKQDTLFISPRSNTPVKPTNNIHNDETFCIQVITPARNLQTGDTEDFPSPCDVPEGWKIIQ